MSVSLFAYVRYIVLFRGFLSLVGNNIFFFEFLIFTDEFIVYNNNSLRIKIVLVINARSLSDWLN